MGFEGFPVAALDFYDDLEMDNTKSFWTAHKSVYDTAVREPMVALCEALEEEFGTAKVFRPYRDVRFAKDKTPYKTSQGAFVATGPATGWYLHIAASGIGVGGGLYHAEPKHLAAIREAIADDRTGSEVATMLTGLQRKKWQLGGEELKTTPRGYDADNPRVELLRHKSLYLWRDYGFDKVIHTPRLLDKVRRDWRALRPLVDWFMAHGD